MADNKSSLVQIAQDVLDIPSQSLKVSVVSGGGGGGDPATEAKQDVQITELQAIKGYVDGVETLLTAVVDPNNSTTAPLGISGVFTGASFDAKDFATLSISVISDQSSATNGISVQYSQDGTNWDHIHTFTFIAGGNGLSYNLPVEMRYVRIVYTNGAVAQTSFRLQSVFRRAHVPPSVYTLEQGLSDYTVASPTKSVIYGKTTGGGGGYVAVKVNPSGALTTEVSGSVSVTNFPATQAVSGTVSVTGVATSANQTSQITELQGIKANTARLDYVGRVRLVYSSTNVTTGAWVQLLSSVGAIAVKEIEIFDSSGETLELGVGAAASEVSKSYVFPGGNGKIPMQIAANDRLAIKAVSATANSGEILINLYG